MNESDKGATSAAELFALRWESPADVLGTAAAANILRRAIQQAAFRTACPERVIVARDGLEYEYRAPEIWKQSGNDEVTRLGRLAPASCSTALPAGRSAWPCSVPHRPPAKERRRR